MQLRITLVAVGATLAILAPSAAARIAPDPLDDGPGTAHVTLAHNFGGLIKKTLQHKKAASAAATGPLTENSNGAGRPQTRPVGIAKAKSTLAAKRQTSKPATRIVVPPMIVVPSNPSTAASTGPDECTTYMVDCTAQQNCDIWGFSCALVQSDGQPADAQPAPGSSSTQ